MKKVATLTSAALLICSLSGCGLMEDAFKAGVIITLVILALIGLVIWILRLVRKILFKYFPSIRISFERFWEED